MENQPKERIDPNAIVLEKDKDDIEKNKKIAILCYLSILCLIPLFIRKDSKFIQFHVKQGLVLLFVEIVIPLLNLIPVIGQFIWVCSVIVLFIYITLGIRHAWNGRYWEMPYLGYYARQIEI